MFEYNHTAQQGHAVYSYLKISVDRPRWPCGKEKVTLNHRDLTEVINPSSAYGRYCGFSLETLVFQPP